MTTTEHVHNYKAIPVPVRKNHNLIIFLLWLVFFFPGAFIYLLIPRGQETQFQKRCSDCGHWPERYDESRTPLYDMFRRS